MSDLHPILQESLNKAVTHILARRGERLTPQDLEKSVDHLFNGLIQGPERAGADWSMVWGHLIHYFWAEGASIYEATQLAMSHFAGIIFQVCDQVSHGQLEEEIDSLEKLEVYIRHAVDAAVLQADMVMEES